MDGPALQSQTDIEGAVQVIPSNYCVNEWEKRVIEGILGCEEARERWIGLVQHLSNQDVDIDSCVCHDQNNQSQLCSQKLRKSL